MRIAGATVVIAVALGAPAGAAAAPSAPRGELVSVRTVAPDVQRMSFRYGPIVAAPGQNLILLGPVTIERPLGAGYITRINPNMKRADGSVPAGDRLHMHHAVALNMSRSDLTRPGLAERFFAFGEEKTIVESPSGYGYSLGGADVLAMNYMIHNLVTQTEAVYITYELDWVPATSATGLAMKAVRPLWLDVRNGEAYPVYDVKRGSGGPDGRQAYPRDVPGAYGSGARLNEWTADRDGVLVGTGAHVHPGGLWGDLDLERAGKRKTIFRSEARYFDPNGPVSWDMAMTVSPKSWRVGVNKGDRLSVDVTYETERASWYESMGIMLAWMAEGGGPDPFSQPIATRGDPTHGHLPENDNYGGEPTGFDPAGLPDGQTLDNRVGIEGFQYTPGGLGLPGGLGNPPTVDPGRSLRFGNLDSAASIFHAITSCKAPCTGSTGVSYPLADGGGDFDSGQLGYGPSGFSAAANRAEWETPRDLEPGTYSYFCRVHPFMRGAFRVRGARRGAGGARGGCSARASISRRSVRLRRGRVGVRVRCARGGSRCVGKLSLTASRGRRTRSRRRGLRIGARRFNIAPGASRVVRVQASRAGRRLLRRRGRLRLRAVATPRRGGCHFRAPRATVTVKRGR